MLRPSSDLMALNDVPLLVADSSGRKRWRNCLLREKDHIVSVIITVRQSELGRFQGNK